MVLGSQVPRSVSPRRYSRGRRRLPGRPRIIVAVVAGVIVMGCWYFWPAAEDKTPSASSPQVAHQAAAVETAPKPTVRAVQRPAALVPSPTQNPVIQVEQRSEPKPVVNPVVPSTARDNESSMTPQIAVPVTGITAIHTTSDSFLDQVRQLIETDQLVEARRQLSERWFELVGKTPLSDPTYQAIRQLLDQVNAVLIYSPRVVPTDPLTTSYTIERGDLLARIAPRYKVTYQLLEHINGVDARRIRVGQSIKILYGPLHAIVDKSEFLIDIFAFGPNGKPIFICHFPVGLGEDGSTPIGAWIVRPDGKVANPGWTNPRTGQVYSPNDPANPVGEYWLGLQGTDDATRGLIGYGIHGTTEPDSIGTQSSMGCVRLGKTNIAMIYKLLIDEFSTVQIVP